MSEGELLQLKKTRKLDIDEDTYYNIIKGKTGSLLASACAVGTYSTTQSDELAQKMKIFGEKVGIAFQIRDDLFDYSQDKVGKPTGNDIREKKITLPLIYTLQKVDKPTRRKIIDILKNKNKSAEHIKFVVDTVIQHGGIEYAKESMYAYRDAALDILKEFKDSPAKEALIELVQFSSDRKY
jgi:octaprenyl-diphosphate synthase